MKVLEYKLLCPVIDTSKMIQIDEYSTKVIVGLTKFEEDYICEVIDEGLDFDVLYDVVKKLNQIIRQYVKDQYSISHPNNTKNIVHVSFRVETAEDITGHMYETDDESIVTTWLDMHNKRQKKVPIPIKQEKKESPVILFDGKSITQKESMEIKDGIFYHGTDARIVSMTDDERKAFAKDIDVALSYMWSFFEPYKFRMDELKDILEYDKDNTLWLKLYDALIHYGAMEIGNEQYQYGSFYLTNFLGRAASYAMESFAFGESGFNAYYMIKAAEKINFEGWNPPKDVISAIHRIKAFANDIPQPVVFKFIDIDYHLLQHENGKDITEDNKHVFLSCGGSFRYLKDVKLQLSDATIISFK